MSAQIIQAEYDTLGNLESRFRSQNESIVALMAQVNQRLSALQNDGWIGLGADSFFDEMDERVLPGIERLAAALATAGDTVARASIILREAEEDAAAIFGGRGMSVPLPWTAGVTPAQPDAQIGRTPLDSIPPRDYALMSQYAYEDTAQQALPSELAAKGWQKLGHYQTDTGYYGVALINHNTGEVVIAHRGTDADWGDLAEPAAMLSNPISTRIAKFFGIDLNSDGSDLDDDAVLAFGGVPGQFYDSRAFVDQVQKQMEQQGYGHYEFLHTGHSLGAFLADMHAAENDESHHRSITFDNPGARESLATLGVTYNPTNHLSYQSHRNLINSANTQTGQEISIRLRTESDKFGIIRDTLHDHSLENMLDVMDPITGRPSVENNIRGTM